MLDTHTLATVTGYPAARRIALPGALALESGASLPAVEIAFEHYGVEAAADGGNVVIVMPGISGDTHAKATDADPRPGWWDEMIGDGDGYAIDTAKYAVIAPNYLGSCFGSTGPASGMAFQAMPPVVHTAQPPASRKPDVRSAQPVNATSSNNGGHGLEGHATSHGPRFPLITPFDQARALHGLITALGFTRVHALVGASLGGMVGCAFAATYPDAVNSIVAISSPARALGYSIALHHLQRLAILNDPAYLNGAYDPANPPADGLILARGIGMVSYRSSAEFNARFVEGDPVGRGLAPNATVADLANVLYDAGSYLTHQGRKQVGRFDPNAYLVLSHCMDVFDLGRGQPSLEAGVARISVPALIVGMRGDTLYPPEVQADLARMLPRGAYLEVTTHYGHDGFLKEANALRQPIQHHLTNLHA